MRSNHRWLAGLAAILTFGALSIAPITSAHADGTPTGGWVIDGVVPDAGTTSLPDLYGNVKELGPINGSSTKIGVINSAPLPMLGYTNPNAQVDLRGAWLGTGKDTSTGDIWLYFAWERDSNTGSGFIAYEFMHQKAPAGCAYDTATDAQLIANCNPWANRQAGDFMILWDQSGTSTQLVLRTWSGTAPNLTLSAGSALDTAVAQAKFSSDGFYGEAAVDLTQTIFKGSTACQSFANTIPSTVTGNSDTADYKDTILKQAPPISNCLSSTVTTPKQSDGTTNISSTGISIGSAGLDVKDSALVSVTGGTATPAGSVAFYLCKLDTGLCSTGGTSVGSTNLSGTSYPVTVVSPSTHITSSGRYCWRAVFSGDSTNGIPGSSDARASECFTVVATSLSSSQSWVPNDSVTVANPTGGNLDGTVSFTLYPNNTCTGTPTLATTTATVSGASPQTVTSTNSTAVAAGSYWWKVSYSSNNAAQSSIASSCQETSTLSVTNGSPVTSG